MDSEDQRDVELLTLSAIYPELQRVSEDDPYTFTLDLPVNPSKTVTVYFPASTGQAPTLNPLQTAPGPADGPLRIDSHQLSYLPALHLQISLPSSYPTVQPPDVHVSTRPSWLPTETAKRLESECARLWEELGRDLVIFSYVDHVQQLADDVFGLVSDKGALEISPEYKISILDHDIGAKRAAFEKQTFDCGVCLDPKKGSKCHQMLDCGHVFCAACLQDFYNNAITEGDITAVRCLEPNCAKEREDASAKSGKKSKTSKVIISPSELLQIPIELDMVRRFVSVKYKTKLESDKNTIYCPRSWCQGAAKSKKHKKPQGLEIADDDSDEEDETGTTSAVSKIYQSEDRLAVCEDCGFAFCSRCLLSWHGEFVLCSKPRNAEEISEEDKASLDFINLHTTPCPTCDSRAQKTFGCNHMQCFRCQTHFCYLCSAWLDPKNPYQHYNEHNGTKTTCYMRLWDLENGDEDGEPLMIPRVAPEQAEQGDPGEIYRALRQGEPQHMQRRRRPDADANRVVLNGAVNLVPEGPRVFRLDVAAPQAEQNNPAQAVAGAAQQPPPQQQQQQARGQVREGGNHRQGRQQQPAPRGRGGRGRGGENRQNPGQRAGQVAFRRDRHNNPEVHEDADPGDQMEDVEAAWVRRFVQLALEDNEDLAFEPFD